MSDTASWEPDRQSSERPETTVGPYRLLEKIGEGGFGIIWLAERREPMVQRVAVKIIKPGMDSKEVIARFEQERQALAVMDHPNVAKVFDGGITNTGLPYFVMEYVQGEHITVFCDRHTYTIKQRLELFIPVCEAVQHAHHKGIIHRDIKPSNIIVSVKDGRAIPKVIDFGVAKAISQTLTDKTIFTETGRLIGTPEYMSPEQAEMGRLDIDTRTDVYSLGVVLYELLAGVVPISSESLRKSGYSEMQRIIREVHAPSIVEQLRIHTASASKEESKQWLRRFNAASRREMQLALRGDLENVVIRAIEKDRANRYETPLMLAQDVRNCLESRPIRNKRTSVTFGDFRQTLPRIGGAVLAVMCGIACGAALAISVFAKDDSVFKTKAFDWSAEAILLPCLVVGLFQAIRIVARVRVSLWYAAAIVAIFVLISAACSTAIEAIIAKRADNSIVLSLIKTAIGLIVMVATITSAVVIYPGIRWTKALKCAGVFWLVMQVWGIAIVAVLWLLSELISEMKDRIL